MVAEVSQIQGPSHKNANAMVAEVSQIQAFSMIQPVRLRVFFEKLAPIL